MKIDPNISEDIERKPNAKKTDVPEEYWSGFFQREEREVDHEEVGVTILMKQWQQDTSWRTTTC